MSKRPVDCKHLLYKKALSFYIKQKSHIYSSINMNVQHCCKYRVDLENTLLIFVFKLSISTVLVFYIGDLKSYNGQMLRIIKIQHDEHEELIIKIMKLKIYFESTFGYIVRTR